MIRSKLTALTVIGLLSVGSMSAFAQSSGNDAPVDKGGMPPYSGNECGLLGREGVAAWHH